MSTVLKLDAREYDQILDVAGCKRRGLMGWISRGPTVKPLVSIGASLGEIPVQKQPPKPEGPLSNAFIAFLEQESAVRSPVVLPADAMAQAYKSKSRTSSSTAMGVTDMSLVFNQNQSSRDKSIIPLPADSIRSDIVPNTAPVILESNLSGISNVVLPSSGGKGGNALFPGL